ncbi:MAG TPA: DUF6496 domain-containing protein [Steroidobacteraceae bacterium]|nr:DUF6496 domain-containing protein [Steroidobacteraceae bacterium]
MPEKQTLDRARADKRTGKSPSTQAGEFVREQIDHIREGKHGARSTKQAIAIGLSEARRSGVDLPPPSGAASAQSRKKAARDSAKGNGSISRGKISATRSRATEKALKREGTAAASSRSLARQARSSAAQRTPAARSAAARKAAATRASHRR